MLNPALLKITTAELIHFPFTVGSQMISTGMHCNVTARRYATMWQHIHAMHRFVTRRKRFSVKIRRKRRRIEILVRFWTKT
jgi:hypothetical protein